MRSIREVEATLSDLLDAVAQRAPETPAILAPGRATLSHGQLQHERRRIAAHLATLGIGRGGRVAIVLPSGPEMAVALLSVMSCATCIPVDPSLPRERLRRILQIAGADAIILSRSDDLHIDGAIFDAGPRLVELQSAPLRPAGIFDLSSDLATGAALAPMRPAPEDVMVVFLTSGTTGEPKRVPLRHRKVVPQLLELARSLGLSPADRCLSMVPLFTASGVRRTLLLPLAAGGSVICTAGPDAASIARWIHEFEPTFYAGGPVVQDAVASALQRSHLSPSRRLRFVWSGSAALRPDLQRRLEGALGCPVLQAYASTEAGVVAVNPLPPADRKPGSVGLPIDCEVRIVDEAGTPLPSGVDGEIEVRGPAVFDGYENDPEATRSAFRDGWFRTGDRGHLDDDGYLSLTGRTTDVINRGGFKVPPLEVEDVLVRHPDVAAAAALGVPHPTLGEDLVAAVVVRVGANVLSRDLRDFAIANLAPHKVPTEIRILPELPRTPLGKVRRAVLAELFSAAVDHTPIQATGHERSEIEILVADIFALVLERPVRDLRSNFFTLGGDSLRGALVVARVNAATGSTLTPSDLFRRPTVAEFAEEASASATSSKGSALPRIRPRRRPTTERPASTPDPEVH
jgi:acyl-CoA synthetase (AMP-forming)/AMP-acid ligase II